MRATARAPRAIGIAVLLFGTKLPPALIRGRAEPGMLSKMKSVVAASACMMAGALLAMSSAGAQVSAGGSTTDEGTYVAPDSRSGPDSTFINGDSYRGDANSHTGVAGVDEYRHAPSLGSYNGPSLNTPMTPDYGISTQPQSDAYGVHPSYGLGGNR